MHNYSKTAIKNVKCPKIVGSIKTFDHFPHKFKNLGGEFCLGSLSKNEEIQFFDSVMHFLVSWTPWICKFSLIMVGHTGSRENSVDTLEREIKPWGVYRNKRGCILEVNCGSIFVYHFVHLNLRLEIFFEKEGAQEKEGVDFEIGDMGTCTHLYLRL